MNEKDIELLRAKNEALAKNNKLVEESISLRERVNEVVSEGLEPAQLALELITLNSEALKKNSEKIAENTTKLVYNNIFAGIKALLLYKNTALLKINEFAVKDNTKKIKDRTNKLVLDTAAVTVSNKKVSANTVTVGANTKKSGGNAKSIFHRTKRVGELTAAQTKNKGITSALSKAIGTATKLSGANTKALVANTVKAGILAKTTKLLSAAQWVLNGALAAGIMLKTMGTGAPIVVAAKGAGKKTTIGGIKAGKIAMAAMATGGVVSAPTVALVGEGRYPEAVVPLGNSPQFSSMKEDIAAAVIQGLSQATITTNNTSSGDVILNIDGERIARMLMPRINDEQVRRGLRPILAEGGAA